MQNQHVVAEQLIIFLDIPIRLLEEFCIGVEFIFCERSPQRLPNFSLPAFGGLPTSEVDLSHDVAIEITPR